MSAISILWKLADCKKWTILDEVFHSRNSVMPKHQSIEKMENIAKRDILWFRKFSEQTRNS